MTLSVDTRRFIAATKYRYLVVNAAGDVVARNEFGKAISFAFSRKPAAVSAARRAGAMLFDVTANAVIYRAGDPLPVALKTALRGFNNRHED